jgi:hypothetical protein
MTETIVRCDGCGRVKAEANHWVAMNVSKRGTILLPSLTVVSFEDSHLNDEHYCGPACANKRFAKFIDEMRVQSTELAAKLVKDAEADPSGTSIEAWRECTKKD